MATHPLTGAALPLADTVPPAVYGILMARSTGGQSNEPTNQTSGASGSGNGTSSGNSTSSEPAICSDPFGSDAAKKAAKCPPPKPLDRTKINAYWYEPSFGMAVIGSMAFLLSFALHAAQLFRTKSWFFFLVTQGALLGAVSMIARTNSVLTLKKTGATGPFVIHSMMDAAAGVMVALGNIFVYTRVMFWVTPNERRNFSTLLSPPFYTTLLWGALLGLADMVKMGGAMILNPATLLSMRIQLIGTIATFFILSAFAFLTLRFMVISRTWLINNECESKGWRKLGWAVCANSILMAVRGAFGVIAQDSRADNRPFWSKHEWTYWVGIVIPLFAVLTVYNFFFPGNYLPREYVGFRLKLKSIAKSKAENPWPLTISPPIPSSSHDANFITSQESKGIEVHLTELEHGRSK